MHTPRPFHITKSGKQVYYQAHLATTFSLHLLSSNGSYFLTFDNHENYKVAPVTYPCHTRDCNKASSLYVEHCVFIPGSVVSFIHHFTPTHHKHFRRHAWFIEIAFVSSVSLCLPLKAFNNYVCGMRYRIAED